MSWRDLASEFSRDPSVMQGVIRISGGARGLQFTVEGHDEFGKPRRQVFTNFQEAQRATTHSGVTRQHIFDPAAWRTDPALQPRVGIQRFHAIDEISRVWQGQFAGGRLIRETINLRPETLEGFQQRAFVDDDVYGLISARPEQVDWLRFQRATGELDELGEAIYEDVRASEIIPWLRENELISRFEDDPKTAIRMRTIMNERTFGAAGEIGGTRSPFTAVVFNPTDEINIRRFMNQLGVGYDEAVQMAERASDGQILVGEKFMRRLMKQLDDEASQMLKMAAGDKSIEAIEQHRLASLLRDTVRKMRADITNSPTHLRELQELFGVVRIGGVQAVPLEHSGGTSMNPLELSKMTRAQQQRVRARVAQNMQNAEVLDVMAKGGLFTFSDLPGRLGVDMITAGAGETPADEAARIAQGVARNVSGGALTRQLGVRTPMISFMPHHAMLDASADIGSLLAHGEVLGSIDDFVRHRHLMLEEELEYARQGQMPPGWKRRAELRALNLPSDPTDRARVMQRTTYDRLFLEAEAMGLDPMRNPLLARMRREGILKGMRREDRRGTLIPNFRTPGSIESSVAVDLGDELGLRPNEIAFHNNTWIMRDIDFAVRYQAHGGFDLDDTLANQLRWNEETGRFAVVVTRRPNIMGELSFMWLQGDAHSEAVRRYLQQRDPEFRALVEEHEDLQNEIRRDRKMIRKYGGRKRNRDAKFEALDRVRQNTEAAVVKEQQITDYLNDTGRVTRHFQGISIADMANARTIGTQIDAAGNITYIPGSQNVVDNRLRGAPEGFRYHTLDEVLGKHGDAQSTDLQRAAEKARRAARAVEELDADYIRHMRETTAAAAVSRDAIGQITNTQYLMQSFMRYASNPEVGRVLGERGAMIVQPETVVDVVRALQLREDESKEVIRALQRSTMRAMYDVRESGVVPTTFTDAEGVVRNSFGMDPYIYENRARFREGFEQELKLINLERQRAGQLPLTMENFLLHTEDPRAFISQVMRAEEAFLGAAPGKLDELWFNEANQLPDSIKNFTETERSVRDANILEEAAKRGRAKAAKGALTNREVLATAVNTGMLEEDDTVGRRMFEAVATLLKRGDRGIRTATTMGGVGMADIYLRTLGHFAGVDFAEAGIAPITRSDIVLREAGGQVRFSQNILSEMARQFSLFNPEDAISSSFMQHVTNSMDVGENIGREIRMENVPDSIRALFDAPDDVARVVIDETLPGPWSPRALIQLPGADGPEELGRLIQRALDGESTLWQGLMEATSRHGAGFRHLEEMLTSTTGSTLAAAEEVVTPALRRGFENAREATMTQEQILASRAERAVTEAQASIPRGVIPFEKSGPVDMARKLWGTRAGRAGIIGAAGIAALGLIRAGRRNRDHSMEDMQGPAHLPGGNPYTAQGFDRLQVEPPPYGQTLSSGGSGVRYEIQARGGNNDSALIDAIAQVTGVGAINSTRYEVPEAPGFQSESTRQRILEQY